MIMEAGRSLDLQWIDQESQWYSSSMFEIEKEPGFQFQSAGQAKTDLVQCCQTGVPRSSLSLRTVFLF